MEYLERTIKSFHRPGPSVSARRHAGRYCGHSRRILIESARRKVQQRRGGGWNEVELNSAQAAETIIPEQLLLVDDALAQLETQAPPAAEVFKMKYFASCSIEEAAQMTGMSRATAYRHWTFARAWLASRFESDE